MSDQVIDTRDLIERRDELKELIHSDFIETFPQYEDRTDSFEDILLDEEEIQDWKEGFTDELEEIEQIDEIESDCTDFQHGETLINDGYFEDYCKEMCEDCGNISKDFPRWIEIDWDATANNMKEDYTSVTYRGEVYYTR